MQTIGKLISPGTSMSQLMAKSRLRDGTEPVVFFPVVAKQHDVFAGAISFRVLENLPKPALVPPTALLAQT